SRAAKRRGARSLHAIIAVCESDARLLREEFGLPANRVRVILNGVERSEPGPGKEAARAALGIPSGVLVVGCAAALEPNKGVQDLVEAMRSISVPGRVLALAGEGSLSDVLAGAAPDLPYTLLLPGRITPLARFLDALDLFVLPSHREAMPLSL